jgi:hypothetical protein
LYFKSIFKNNLFNIYNYILTFLRNLFEEEWPRPPNNIILCDEFINVLSNTNIINFNNIENNLILTKKNYLDFILIFNNNFLNIFKFSLHNLTNLEWIFNFQINVVQLIFGNNIMYHLNINNINQYITLYNYQSLINCKLIINNYLHVCLLQ